MTGPSDSSSLFALSDVWQSMSGQRRSPMMSAKRLYTGADAPAAAPKEVPEVKLHPRDERLGDLVTAKEYPHRFNVRPDDEVDQVEWQELGDDGKTVVRVTGQHRISSHHSRDLCYMKISNTTSHTVRMLWVDYQGNEVAYEKINPGDTIMQQTFLTHPWVVREVTTCTQLLLNGRIAFIPSDPEHKDQVAAALAAQKAQQRRQQQQQQPGDIMQQHEQQQEEASPLRPFRGTPVFEVKLGDLPQLTWTKEAHGLFPDWFKASMKTFLLCHQQQRELLYSSHVDDESTILAHIPAELLPNIVARAAPTVPQGIHYPPHGRMDIKPARLAGPPTKVPAAPTPMPDLANAAAVEEAQFAQ